MLLIILGIIFITAFFGYAINPSGSRDLDNWEQFEEDMLFLYFFDKMNKK